MLAFTLMRRRLRFGCCYVYGARDHDSLEQQMKPVEVHSQDETNVNKHAGASKACIIGVKTFKIIIKTSYQDPVVNEEMNFSQGYVSTITETGENTSPSGSPRQTIPLLSAESDDFG